MTHLTRSLFCIALGFVLAQIGSAAAIKPGACSAELEKARVEIDRLDTELRLRTGELRVARGQLKACQKKVDDEPQMPL